MTSLLKLDLFVISNLTKERVPVYIAPMSSEDAEQTIKDPYWQTSWNTPFIRDYHKKKFALKTKEGELIGLAAYEIHDKDLIIYLAYMESHPESNPTIVIKKENRKYDGIGKALVAYGVAMSFNQGFGGAVTLDAKTPELEKHYINDFGAILLPSFGGAPRLLIPENEAYQLASVFFSSD